MVWRKLGLTTTTTTISSSKVKIVNSLLLVFAFSLMFDFFSGGDDHRRGGGGVFFVQGTGGRSGGSGFWNSIGGVGGNGGYPSNVGIAIAVTAMAGLAVAVTLVYSRRGHLRLSLSRRRKHALQPKQWKRLFDVDGRLCDGGVQFLKKVRSGGVDPTLRAEVWPFLLGVYDLNSSREEREIVKTKKRKEYEILREQCRQTYKHSDKSFKLKKTSKTSSNEESKRQCRQSYKHNKSFKLKKTSKTNRNEESKRCSQVLDSAALDYAANALDSPSLVGAAGEDSPDLSESNPALQTSLTAIEGEGDGGSEITSENASDAESDSFDSDSVEDADNMQPSPAPERITDKVDNSLHAGDGKSTVSNSECRISNPYRSENFATWQRIMRLDAIRANDEWVGYSPSQAAVSLMKAHRLADTVGLKDYDHLEACRIFHAARLVSILEAYAIYDSEIGYCQGMSDLLSPIISVIEEDYEAFWCFVGFMKKARHNFRLDEVGIRRQLNIVSKIIKGKDSHLYRHLELVQAEDCFFVYRMVVVLFRRELNFEQTLCLWEVMWADQTAIRAGIAKSGWGRLRLRAPPTDDLLLYAIAACVLQKRKEIIEKYSSMDEILRECNSMAGQLDVWKLIDDAHDLVVTLHDKVEQ